MGPEAAGLALAGLAAALAGGALGLAGALALGAALAAALAGGAFCEGLGVGAAPPQAVAARATTPAAK